MRLMGALLQLTPCWIRFPDFDFIIGVVELERGLGRAPRNLMVIERKQSMLSFVPAILYAGFWSLDYGSF